MYPALKRYYMYLKNNLAPGKYKWSSVADQGEGPPLILDQSHQNTIKHQNCERAKTKCLRAGPHLTSRSGPATGPPRSQRVNFQGERLVGDESLALDIISLV